MRIVSFTEARNSLKAVLDAVVMSLDYYNSLMEIVHLLRSPANAEHLNRSIAQFKAGKVTQRDLIDE
ncbi:type II toxin-antitoxin system prevent-host-death family antitoxin [Maribrevibacterium harenarium]|uniref:Antitoxin n=1 Tax=Maribrevibacterium harenarium TaxID=2589817 RepID=A0A501WXX9_9GAMM|nr:type II toxin-antitoxin system Phd/YefM family antitoxin [Maribrevibacterium harenarium]TPE54109.1 type II toxin-antitoxin system prevent-host-death family antitoxin [Maribrevibacterium harenarium]